MKKILLMALFASTFACSSSDDISQPTVPNTPPETQHLSGRWNLSHKSVNGQIQAISDCEDQYNYYQFSADGGAIVGKFRMYQVGMTNYCEQSTTEGDYTIEDGVLTYTKSSGYVSKYNVISANDLTIKLEMFYYTTNLGEINVPQNERIIEICNKAE
ncbi:lipocalin-like domain-containing protein [Flavobacterium caeni]|nr:lipocalin family protein [Flavobacterium caeni]